MKTYKLAVIGSRSYDDEKQMFDYLDSKKDFIEWIISGGAKGADSLSQKWAISRGKPILIFPPRWYDDEGNFRKSAGFERNNLIIKNCDYVLAYWDEKSSGTKNSIEWAEKLGKKVKIMKFEPKCKDIRDIQSVKEL